MVRCIDCGHCHAFYYTVIPDSLQLLHFDHYECVKEDSESYKLHQDEMEVEEEISCEKFVKREKYWEDLIRKAINQGKEDPFLEKVSFALAHKVKHEP